MRHVPGLLFPAPLNAFTPRGLVSKMLRMLVPANAKDRIWRGLPPAHAQSALRSLSRCCSREHASSISALSIFEGQILRFCRRVFRNPERLGEPSACDPREPEVAPRRSFQPHASSPATCHAHSVQHELSLSLARSPLLCFTRWLDFHMPVPPMSLILALSRGLLTCLRSTRVCLIPLFHASCR